MGMLEEELTIQDLLEVASTGAHVVTLTPKMTNYGELDVLARETAEEAFKQARKRLQEGADNAGAQEEGAGERVPGGAGPG